MHEQSDNERALLRRIAEGDEDAFRELFHQYTPRLAPFIFRLTRNEDQAAEIIQETFLQLWQNRAQLKDVKYPSAWIHRIASNIAVTWLRSLGRKRKALAAHSTASEAEEGDAYAARELSLLIHQAVDALPDKRRAIYRLSREEGMNHEQIAQQLGLSVSTVSNQIGHALKFIREYIARETGLSIVTILLLTRF